MKVKAILGILISLLVLVIPKEWIPLGDISVLEQRLLAIFTFAVIFWVLEPIPVFATSVLIIMLELLMISDKGLIFFTMGKGSSGFGSLVSYKTIMGSFASPIILLFLGGFFLAMAATKYRLDTNLARVFLKPFGQKPSHVMLGLMVITAIFSMFMSNTATTAMMLAVLAPVLKAMDLNDRGRVGFALAVPFAANIGGIGTPIGTPPNAVAIQYLTGDHAISFGRWMLFALPYVVVMLIITWAVICFMFPSTSKKIKLDIRGKFMKTPSAITVYFVFGLTILLWLIGGRVHGMSSHVVAMIPVSIFCATKIITAGDLKKMSWDVLWLVSGGIALGLGMGETGLSSHIVSAVPFAEFSPMLIVVVAGVVALLMSTFMSNTATANLLLPIMAALGASLVSLEGYGGSPALIIIVSFACSLAMSLPVSTPPNALGHATGLIKIPDMAKAGAVIGSIGLLLSFVMLAIMNAVGFFN